MIETETEVVVPFGCVIDKFSILTNWSSTHTWNTDFSKSVVFNPIFNEEVFQYEQDWMCYYYLGNYEYVTVDENSLLNKYMKNMYKSREVFDIPFGAILRWLVLRGELPDIERILVKS